MGQGDRAGRRLVGTQTAKDELLSLIRSGERVKDALRIVERSRSWYQDQRRRDPEWAALCDHSRHKRLDLVKSNTEGVEFAEFSEKYLGVKVWPHMMNVVDMLEGREPSWLHESMRYEKGTAGLSRLLVNVPPNHAKSMTVTINYVTYRVCKDPNINVIIVSKTQDQAKKFLYAIKQRLTHPRYADLQAAFGPTDGFKSSAEEWSATRVYLGGDRDSDSKDPTIEAIGMGGMIYGSRAHLIVLDDVVTLTNSADWQKQQDWIRQEVASRLPPRGGQLLVVGTRVAAIDLYKELRSPEHYTDGSVPWSYLAMPAVLETTQDPKDWKTLWPRSEQRLMEDDEPDDDGYFERWSGERLAQVRNEVGPSKWSLVYQNLDVAEDAIFDPVCVKGSVNGMRYAGPLSSGVAGHPKDPEGFYRVIGIDPAMSGDTASVAYAVDRRSGKRYVMDVDVMTSPTPAAIRTLIRNWAERYTPHTIVVESNAFQLFLTQDEEIRSFLASKGISYRPHHTGSNKQDPEFGVASLAPLFGSKTTKEGQLTTKHAGDNLIELPATSNENVRKLIEQLITWQPGIAPKKLKQDAVMALWFAELVAREQLFRMNSNYQTNFMSNEFVTRGDMHSRFTINLNDMISA